MTEKDYENLFNAINLFGEALEEDGLELVMVKLDDKKGMEVCVAKGDAVVSLIKFMELMMLDDDIEEGENMNFNWKDLLYIGGFLFKIGFDFWAIFLKLKEKGVF